MLSSLATRLSGHPRRTLLITLLFVVIAGAIGGPLAGSLKSSGGFAPPNSDSQVATRMLQRATGTEPVPGIVLLVHTAQGATAADARTRIAALDARLRAVPGVVRTVAPADVSRDGRYVLIAATLSARADDKTSATDAVSAFAHDRDVTVGGPQVADEQISSTVTQDLGFAELLAFPLLIVLSILFFRGRAALMPLAVGVTTVLGTFLVLTGVNHLYNLSIFALNLVIGMGLGLAVDYTLFLVTRFRQELAEGATVGDAVVTTMTRAGRTVLFSAVTVACALATLTLFPQGFLKSMGIAGAATAIVAAVAAVTVSPALLGLWGLKLARADVAAGHDRWYRFATAVMRRPGVVAATTAAVMVIAALPALGTIWSSANDSSVIPKDKSARTVADALTRDFAGAGRSPVTVAVRAPSTDGAAVAAYARQIAAIPGVRAVSPPRRLNGDTWQIDAPVAGDSAGPTAQRVVGEIRDLRVPFTAKVTGDAATFVDQQNAIGSHLPEAIGLLVLLTFVVLWLMTGSVVLPIKAILMNTLTVGAALTPLVLIYQHGNLTGLLGYTSDGGVEPTDFVVAATVVFALSTDYGVFLLGRIKEAREELLAARGIGQRAAGGLDQPLDERVDEREAVATGLAATGRVVTAAAILLAVAIGAFSTSSISFIQEIGVAVATGVLLDAFVVRSLLVPSLMALLGRWNWWSPRGLRRLHERVAPQEARVPGLPAPAV